MSKPTNADPKNESRIHQQMLEVLAPEMKRQIEEHTSKGGRLDKYVFLVCDPNAPYFTQTGLTWPAAMNYALHEGYFCAFMPVDMVRHLVACFEGDADCHVSSGKVNLDSPLPEGSHRILSFAGWSMRASFGRWITHVGEVGQA